MRGARALAAGRRRLLVLGVPACVVAGATAALLLLGLAWHSGKAAGQGASSAEHFYTEAAMPANEVVMLGASPREAPGETWAIGRAGQTSPPAYVILRYTDAGGWTREAPPQNGSGQTLTGFAPASTPLAGDSTPDGSVVLAGFVGKAEVLLVRSPGKGFRQTSSQPQAEESEEATLREGESLFDTHVPLVAALEEGSLAGALAIPGEAGLIKKPEPAVLHYEAATQTWTREKVKLPEGANASEFQPVALAATSPTNAWLLARVTSSSEGVSLFHRVPGEEGAPATWRPVSPGAGKPAGEALTIAGQQLKGEPDSVGQALTVTEQGVWVDGTLSGDKSAMVFFKPPTSAEGEGEVVEAWCAEVCTSSLPEELPLGPYRSFAWPPEPKVEEETAEKRPYGERIITGFANGTLLRIGGPEGKQFEQVNTIGDAGSPYEIGGTYGAAFAGPEEGWLGNIELPVRASTVEAQDRLEYWPTPFHRPLLAAAAQPGGPIASESSEAVAVGEGGEVARYKPGAGWQPESLFEVSGRRAETQLRSVAWPTRKRIYAVGGAGATSAVLGEMWLWREETGLWEPDPAEPVNLRANLLGIAFEPLPKGLTEQEETEWLLRHPLRGYVVGQEGTLLRYGKTWTQEPFCTEDRTSDCLPAELANASFTSVAFAGSEALVAYRLAHLGEGTISYTGGVLANSGSGWHLDTEAAAALPSGYVPWAVAGLPDGGAALSASVPGGLQEPLVLERQGAGDPWQATPQPYPGYQAPASLALFREGGALRVVGSGAIPETLAADNVVQPPAGFPPALPAAYPPGLGTGLIRQTASGWSDQEHERKIMRPPPGGYVHWDIPYDPDPTAAILLNEEGTEGWAVGGYHASHEGAETADIARYPGTHPHKEEPRAAIGALNSNAAVFALGGGAQCAAPCSTLTNARIGPDTWLRSALERAKETSGLRAFIYTGPRVTTGEAIHPFLAIPYAREFEDYAELLKAGPQGKTLVTASATDREGTSECTFDEKLKELMPLGTEAREENLGPLEAKRREGECAGGNSAYYSFQSEGNPSVLVLVLDDSGEVSEGQLGWLSAELASAKNAHEPALVVGTADLSAEDANHNDPSAEALTSAIVREGAAAYLFYAPEENVKTMLVSSSGSVPAFGTGTLGYINAIHSEESDFIGASGFLLIEVYEADPGGSSSSYTVNARLIPDIEELSIDAHKGLVLHRSEAALFSALARRPRAGGVGSGSSNENESASFVPLTECEGGRCEEAIKPEYEWRAINKKNKKGEEERVGSFVHPNLADGPEEVKLEHEEPVGYEDAPRNYGLFCAYNPGYDEVEVEAGGLTARLPVHVLSGSPRRPCGTVPTAKVEPKPSESTTASPEETPQQKPEAAPPPVVPLPPPPAAAPIPPRVHPAAVTPLQPLLLVDNPFTTPIGIVPPPAPPAAQPTPPTGASTVEAVQKEEEEEEAPESASAQASAYRQSEHEPSSAYLLGLIVLAAFAGSTIRGRLRRSERRVQIAPATVSTQRRQRRVWRERRPPW